MMRMRFLLVSIYACMVMHVYAAVDMSFSPVLFARNIAPLSSLNDPQYIAHDVVITQPGIYALSADIVFEPTADGQACIVIQASNVILDLSQNTISQKVGNSYTNISGIEVAPGCKNVVIRNGNLSSIAGTGIIVQDDVQILDIVNIAIMNSVRGIVLDGGQENISEVTLANIKIASLADDIAVYGLKFHGCRAVTLENVTVSSSEGLTGDFVGYSFDACKSVVLKSCMASQNMTTGFSMIGYEVTDSVTVGFIGCNAAHNTVNNADALSHAYGFYARNSEQIFIRDGSSFKNTAVYDAVGFMFDTCTDCFMLDCQSVGVGSVQSTAAAIQFDHGNSNTVRGCQLLSTRSANAHAMGVYFNHEIGSIVIESEIKGNNGTGVSYGILLDGCSGCSVQKNSISGHRGGSGGYGVFDTAGLSATDVVLSNIAAGNTVNFSPEAPVIPLFSGPISATPSPFENISLPLS